MIENFVYSQSLPDFLLWEKIKDKRVPLSFDIEITARCNNDCRHCYINLPVDDQEAKAKELSFEDILKIAREAVSMGAMWCLLTGGEPLLREDFFEIFLALKRIGLLVSVFTNGCLVTPEHVKFFKKYPPRNLEITVYGVTGETYEGVTRRPGSFAAFRRGLELLLKAGVKVRFKAMALKINVHELPAIAEFCRVHTKDYFRFDPQLHLRFDGNPLRNEEIRGQRLSPEEIVAIERADPERFLALNQNCGRLIGADRAHPACGHLFHCGAGQRSFAVSYDGQFRLCPSLWHPDCISDLRRGSLNAAWDHLVPKVRETISQDLDFLKKCRACHLLNLCLWCPAHAYLESGRMDAPVEYFCRVAHARAMSLETDRI
ncbi:MAG: radical SAM protein [Proteobacteria bacterium]|nr:radical SAM protein [Pseudomonadota bacterium]